MPHHRFAIVYAPDYSPHPRINAARPIKTATFGVHVHSTLQNFNLDHADWASKFSSISVRNYDPSLSN